MSSPSSYSSAVTITRPSNTTAYTAGDAIGINPGTLQVETATAAGTITEAVAQVETATAAGTIDAGTSQVETATIVGTITTSGDAEVIVTGAGITGSPVTVPVAVLKGVKQVESTTVVGSVAVGDQGDAEVIVTAAGMTGSPKTLSVFVGGVKQVETATVVGTIGAAGAGDAEVIVTAAGMTNSPKTIAVAVANDDTASAVGGKIRTALAADADVGDAGTGFFVVSGSGANVVLTAKLAAANDATLNVSIDNDTCTGLTAAPTSANTTAGVAGDTASTIAGKIRDALIADADIGHPDTGWFDVTGSGEDIVLTAAAEAANDATMNISVADDTSSGVGSVLTSTNTTAGVAPDNAAAVATKIRTALDAVDAITDLYTVGGSGDDVTLTRTIPAANDATLNIAFDNDTCAGLTGDASSANTTAGVVHGGGLAEVVVTGAALENSPITFSVSVAAGDTAAEWAEKVRTALEANENIIAAYAVSGADESIVLTANEAVADDATLNISLDNDTCTGITTAATSADTTAGVASGTGNAEVIVTSAIASGSPITFDVAVVAGDTAATWAGKVRTALGADTRITDHYTVSGSNESIVLTAKVAAANDATLNIALDNGTCTGITTAASSANTTGGSATSSSAGSAILSFPLAADKGGQVYVTDVNLEWDVSSLTSGATNFRLHLYDASPAAILDNAAWDLSTDADRGKYLGYVDIAQPADLGSTLYSQNAQVNKLVKLAADSNTLYGVLQTIAGYTPASAAVMKLSVSAVAA